MSDKKLSTRMREGGDAHAGAVNTGPLRAAIREWATEARTLELQVEWLAKAAADAEESEASACGDMEPRTAEELMLEAQGVAGDRIAQGTG